MAETNELQTKIGTEEVVTLKPAKVEILEGNIEEVGQKKARKVVFTVKHPEAENPIKISATKWENKGKLEVSGLWYNTDSKKQIRKGCALATFLLSLGAENISGTFGKLADTVPDENGYLVFKSY